MRRATGSSEYTACYADREQHRPRATQNRKLQTQEQLVDAGVVGELGMERRGEDLALAQADHIAVHRRFDEEV